MPPTQTNATFDPNGGAYPPFGDCTPGEWNVTLLELDLAPITAALAAYPAACSKTNFSCVDDVAWTYSEAPTSCDRGHVCITEPLSYPVLPPPLCGQHRPWWPRWGVYDRIPPQRYLHALEHGSAVILVHPCASQSTVDALALFMLGINNVNMVMATYPLWDAYEYGVLFWNSGYYRNCVNVSELTTYVASRSGKSPEPPTGSGPYAYLWQSYKPVLALTPESPCPSGIQLPCFKSASALTQITNTTRIYFATCENERFNFTACQPCETFFVRAWASEAGVFVCGAALPVYAIALITVVACVLMVIFLVPMVRHMRRDAIIHTFGREIAIDLLEGGGAAQRRQQRASTLMRPASVRSLAIAAAASAASAVEEAASSPLDYMNWVPTLKSIRKVIPLVHSERYVILWQVCVICISIGVGLFQPTLSGWIINVIASPAPTWQALAPYLYISVALTVSNNIISLIASFILTYQSRRLSSKLRSFTFYLVIIQSCTFYDANPPGELINRVMLNSAVGAAFVKFLYGVLKVVLTLPAAIFFLFYTRWQIAIFTLIRLPDLMLLSIATARIRRKYAVIIGQNGVELTQKLLEALSNHPLVLSFATHCAETRRFFEMSWRNDTVSVKLFLKLTPYSVLGTWISTAHGYLIQLLSLWMVIQGNMSVGTYTAILQYNSTALDAVQGAYGLYSQWAVFNGDYRWILFFLRDYDIDTMMRESERGRGIEDPSGAFGLPRRETSVDVSFNDVSFSYPSRLERPALRNVTLKFPANTKNILIGPNGSGKSTMLKLLVNHYTPTHGMILMDGQNISYLNAREMAQMVGYVSQQPALFTRTLAENLCYGLEEASCSRENMLRALEEAHCADILAALPDGLDTVIGNASLSGGQRQRVCLARMFMRHTSVLVLDEVTAALDPSNVLAAQRALEKLRINRTVIEVTHDMAAVRGADFLHVFNLGKLVQTGAPRTLARDEIGLFRRFLDGKGIPPEFFDSGG